MFGHIRVSAALFCAVLALGALPSGIAAGTISYNRDVRPILSDNCFFCHGPDQNKRKGKLRLDQREEAITRKAIVPGKPEESELVRRIFTHDGDDQMPPADSTKKLTDSQKELLRAWIADGAKYEGHWAYIPPTRPGAPAGSGAIDFLVRRRLDEFGLRPSIEADRRTLARRLYFDLVGLPPRPEDVEAFQKDESSEAYAKLVKVLMNSPHFGERQAIAWLDIARYADTIGYHSDTPRNVWPYRDYVIKAFNENKPFDRFTREQLAGDLLPDSTREQKVASAFNRLILSTEEGGAQAKDYEARMLTDRVRAVSAIWLGQTFGCSQCHDHKFDPIKQRDFYSLGAFFADIKEPIIGRREEGMPLPDAAQKAELARLDEETARLQKENDGPHPELAAQFADWEKRQWEDVAQDHRWALLTPSKVESAGGAKLSLQSDKSVLAKGKKPGKDTYTISITNALTGIVALRLEALPDASLPAKGPGRGDDGNFFLTEVTARVERDTDEAETLKFSHARASFEQTDSNPSKKWTAGSTIDGNDEASGWAILPEVGKQQQLVLEFAEPFSMEEGDTLTIALHQNYANGTHTLGHFRLGAATDADALRGPLQPPPSKEIAELLAISADQRDQNQKHKLFSLFKADAPELANLKKQIAGSQKSRTDYEATIPHCLVSISADQPRTVRILPRGNFLVETGEIVKPALPRYLTIGMKEQPSDERRLDRLALANWIVSRDNPLTARVTMNRLWKQFFGIGLSKVLDDFGAQGEPPQNQPLLDWLACELMDSGWDMKHIIKLIVESETYRQISIVSKELRARDPYNRELAAQSRWRLDAEIIRDNALAISGLLSPKIGGPSVFPYQPDGYWENLNFPVRSYAASKGEDQYRRGLYTWWQRSYLHPSLLAFDAPTREECAAERNRSNIPQQALALLNDPTYVEASRAFAVRILTEGGAETTTRITWAWRQALARVPNPEEIETIQALLTKHLAEYRENEDAAKALLHTGLQPAPTALDTAELAAWTSVARVIFNLHETITRS